MQCFVFFFFFFFALRNRKQGRGSPLLLGQFIATPEERGMRGEGGVCVYSATAKRKKRGAGWRAKASYESIRFDSLIYRQTKALRAHNLEQTGGAAAQTSREPRCRLKVPGDDDVGVVATANRVDRRWFHSSNGAAVEVFFFFLFLNISIDFGLSPCE